MAVLLNTTQTYTVANFLTGTGVGFTMMGWGLVPSFSGNTYTDFFASQSRIGSSLHAVGADHKWSIGTPTNDYDATANAATNTWYHVALVRNGTSKRLYVDGVLVVDATDSAAASTTFAVGDWGGGAGNWNGRAAAIKGWEGILTVEEILAEMRQYLPVRTANLRGFYPFHSTGDDQVDFSGGGRTFTVAGAPVNADGPPVPWKLGRGRIWIPVAGGGGQNLEIEVGDSIAFADAPAKQPGKAAADSLTLAELLAKLAALAKADAFSLADAKALTAQITKSDSASVADAVIKTAFKQAAGGAGSASYRHHTATTYASRTNTTLTAPTGIQDDDMLVIFFLTHIGSSTAPTPTPSAGFTAIANFPIVYSSAGSGGEVRIEAWYKKADGESGDYTVTHATCSSQGFIVAVQGANPDAAPIATVNESAGASNPTALSLTTTVDNTFVMFGAGTWDIIGSVAPPSGSTPTFTERQDGGIMYVADGVLAAAGATGDKSIALSQAFWGAALIGVAPRPASDSISFADSVVAILLLIKEVSDALSFADALAKVPGLAKSDGITLGEARTLAIQIARADGLTVADAIAKHTTRSASESIAFADAFSAILLQIKQVVDAFTAADALVKQPQKGLADSVSLTDLIARAAAIARADSIALVDTVLRDGNKRLVDLLLLADAALAIILGSGPGFIIRMKAGASATSSPVIKPATSSPVIRTAKSNPSIKVV